MPLFLKRTQKPDTSQGRALDIDAVAANDDTGAHLEQDEITGWTERRRELRRMMNSGNWYIVAALYLLLASLALVLV